MHEHVTCKTKSIIGSTQSKHINTQTHSTHLTHVKLVMVKSHCIYTCIKNSQEYCVLYVKNIAKMHKCIHVMTI